ncbi:MAG TPA: hypothetical protein VIA62_19350 [Thermoanaerobaculia bacterium]|nr:hypothetical protein [Thermoanaerobaculia bacterium]
MRAEPVLRPANARLVFADYTRLQRDFPRLGEPWLLRAHPELHGLSAAQRQRRIRGLIDAWLLRSAAVVSTAQAAQAAVNTPIATAGGGLTAFRPPLYGRALVTSLAEGRRDLPPAEAARWRDEPDGLLDVKGTGVAPGVTPSPQPHSNGLLALGEALTNIAFREVIELIFRRAGTRFETIPDYALIDLGFDVRGLYGPLTPAGLQVRQAHRRPLGGAELPLAGSPEQRVKLEIEMLLRHYGLTSCSGATGFVLEERGGRLEITYAGKPVPPHTPEQIEQIRRFTRYPGGRLCLEGVNVQLAREVALGPSRARVVDFGHYSVRERFTEPVLSLVRDRLLRWGGALWPGEPFYVQPDSRLRLAVEDWGTPREPGEQRSVPGHAELVWPRPFVLGFELAHGFRSGTLSGEQVRARLDELVASVARSWAG